MDREKKNSFIIGKTFIFYIYHEIRYLQFKKIIVVIYIIVILNDSNLNFGENGTDFYIFR